MSKQSFQGYMQRFFRPSRFSTFSQITVSVLAGPFGLYLYLIGQKLATAKGRVRMEWATFFLVLTTIIAVVLWQFVPNKDSGLLLRVIRAMTGLLFLSFYSFVKHPEEQGVPDETTGFAAALPVAFAVFFGLALESGLRKILLDFFG